MPCSDVTELLTIELDREERVKSYSLTKRTCGGAMGRDSLILKLIRNRSVSELLALPAHLFYGEIQFSSDLKEMVYLKHYFAVQAGLAAYVGKQAKASRGECTLESVIFGSDGIELTGLVNVDMSTNKISACGGCAACGSKKTDPIKS